MKSIESITRYLSQRKQVGRIEIVCQNGNIFTAIAYPAPWHSIISKRRQVALSAKAEWSIAEAQAVENKTRESPLCRETARTALDAMVGLASKIETGEFDD